MAKGINIGTQRIRVGSGQTVSKTPKAGVVLGERIPNFAHAKFPKSIVASVNRGYKKR